MRLGKVVFNIEYVVDLDNETMIDDAIEAIFDDIDYNRDWDEFKMNVDVLNAPEAKESDIPEFLIEEEEDGN